MQSVADRAIQMMQGKENSVFARRYCPKVTFHPGEQHFPCSIEHLLHGSVLKRRAADQWETIKVGPSADELGECNDSQNCYVDISPAQLGGCLPVNHVIDAPVYVAFVEVDDSFIDIYYIFLYAFQGSATFRCWPPGKHFNVITHEFGRHLGDIEHCVVRTDLALSKVISVGYETHDKLAWFLPGTPAVRSLAVPACQDEAYLNLQNPRHACRGVCRRRWAPASLCIFAQSCFVLLQCTNANPKGRHWRSQ